MKKLELEKDVETYLIKIAMDYIDQYGVNTSLYHLGDVQLIDKNSKICYVIENSSSEDNLIPNEALDVSKTDCLKVYKGFKIYGIIETFK